MRRPFMILAFVFAAFRACSPMWASMILMFSVPMLNALYPAAIVLVLMGLVHGFTPIRRCGCGRRRGCCAECYHLGPRCVLCGRVVKAFDDRCLWRISVPRGRRLPWVAFGDRSAP